MQLSKTIYFNDYETIDGKRSGLTVPFPSKDSAVFEVVQPLSSYSLRQLLGYESIVQLREAASLNEAPVATYARQRLKSALKRKAKRYTNDRSGLQATFQGGKGSPLHDWFPYLEGYSPAFVEGLLARYAPNALTVFDPFCGSGTSVIVAAKDGRAGRYTEVNPACRFVIEAKFLALSLTLKERQKVARTLHKLIIELPSRIASSKKDRSLENSFTASFGARPFFDDANFIQVLKTRTLADSLTQQDTITGKLFTVAALRALVESSLLLRRGDLRFARPNELEKGVARFQDVLVQGLNIIASDILDLPTMKGTVSCMGDDAKNLSQIESSSVDAVVTSPPYLNGTNYFRNTKIELWFLREIRTKHDLRRFRDKAITAGINDVTKQKSSKAEDDWCPEILVEVVKELDRKSYDKRIALMVESYFREMHLVIAEWARILTKDGVICIDLGDSCYSGVWVPTHDILKTFMEKAGFTRIDNVVLRERQSRDGRKLTQTVQVFKKAIPNATNKSFSQDASSYAPSGWTTFRNNLPHQKGNLAKRNWGNGLHSLCSYQGKLKPSIAHTLVKALMPKQGGKLLDPFSGVGTIPFEARMLGHYGYGFDISPTAVAISRAKLQKVDEDEVAKVMIALGEWIATYRATEAEIAEHGSLKFNGLLADYFHTETFDEILAAREFFKRHPATSGSSALVFSALMHILHGNRPYALSRRSHPITPFAPTGPIEHRLLMPRLEAKVARSLAQISEGKPTFAGRSYNQDATAAWPEEINDLDAIITSPPFFDSTRFHMANWMRLWFAGWDRESFAIAPKSFIDERQKQTFEVYHPIFLQAAERLKSGGVMAIHLGRSRKCDMASELTEIGSKFLKLIDVFDESVEHCESHGIRDKGTVTHHQYLLFQA